MTIPKPFKDPDFWIRTDVNGKPRYREVANEGEKVYWQCIVCDDGRARERKHCEAHEKSAKHKTAAAYYRNKLVEQVRVLEPWHPLEAVPPEGPEDDNHLDYSEAEFDYDFPPQPVETTKSFMPYDLPLDLEVSVEEADLARITAITNDWMSNGPTININSYSDDDEGLELSDVENNITSDSSPSSDDDDSPGVPRPKQQGVWKENDDWFPWPDKISCIIDILRHVPRSIISDKQAKVILWSLKALGVAHVPSISTVKALRVILQKSCGIRSIRCRGSFGHIYYVNDFLSIISQEVANPYVRPYLEYLPEDAREVLCNANQARRWLYEMDPALLTPMIRMGSQDYYVFEPAIMTDSSYCIPYRWFKRQGNIYARAWRICPHQSGSNSGWLVCDSESVEFLASLLAVSFPYFCTTFQHRGVPDPRIILGCVRDLYTAAWKYTQPDKGNRWRVLAKGHRVYAFPIWIYCDDTSGNSSKKWNKHNSFLFTAAGLRHEHVNFEYNVHFLSTSNIAPPLEMFEGILEQLEYGQEHGVWAWDCVYKEVVLLIPSILAFLGDNPMQSEMACHVGMMGKLFCRVCKVEGTKDTGDEDNDIPSRNDAALNTNASNENGNESDRSNASRASTTGRRGKRKETMAQFVDRVQRFMQIGPTRTKAATAEQLSIIYSHAKVVGHQTRSKQLKTEFGIKDTFQDHFMGKIFDFVRKIKGNRDEKQLRLNVYLNSLPGNPINPIWKVRDLDAHCDTPVEILHVVLLGFVKYFWRDAISRIGNEEKALLITRIDCLNVRGLGLSPLSGKTLVQYCGSLTGRDFRAIAQIAPFVLYGILPDLCYDSWLALSALVPLVFQPKIRNLTTHLAKIDHAINHFLICTARWTPRWFNKPKFHVLLHLSKHIRRFGPAILFATETFESYNALIRGLSIHSNRQAPSRDIAWGFANANRLRHLLSNGVFFFDKPTLSSPNEDLHGEDDELHRSSPILAYSRNLNTPLAFEYSKVGPRVVSLLFRDQYIKKIFGAPRSAPPVLAKMRTAQKTFSQWSETFSSRVIASESLKDSNISSSRYILCKSFLLQNNDECFLTDWILIQSHGSRVPIIGNVVEILRFSRSSTDSNTQPDLILAAIHTASALSPTYKMPRLLRTGSYVLARYNDILCTIAVHHNCALHKCASNQTRIIYQERERSTVLGKAIHHIEPEDLILNTAQMRDHWYIQEFSMESVSYDREKAILEGVTRELQLAMGSSSGRRGTSSLAANTTRNNALIGQTQAPQNLLSNPIMTRRPLQSRPSNLRSSLNTAVS